MNVQSHSEPILPPLPESNVWEEHPNGSIDLMGLAQSYVSRWPLLLLSLVAGGALAYVASFAMRPTFEAQAVFLPPPQRLNIADNPLAALWSPAMSGSTYPGLLQSRSVEDSVIKSLDLQRLYNTRDLDETRATLAGNTKVTSDVSGFYTLRVSDRDPQLAQKIAAAYLGALVDVNNRLAVDSATQQEIVFERELGRAKDALSAAQEKLAQAQLSSGVISPQSQTQEGLAAIDQLRVQIQSRDVELAALRQSETDQGPDVRRLVSQIATLQGQLSAMEKSGNGGAGAGLSARRAPVLNLEFQRLTSDVEYHQALYDIVTKQFETVNLQAHTASNNVQIVDSPEVPRKKAAPRRRLWAMGGAIGCFFATVLAVFLADRGRVLSADPVRHQRLLSVRQAVQRPVWKL